MNFKEWIFKEFRSTQYQLHRSPRYDYNDDYYGPHQSFWQHYNRSHSDMPLSRIITDPLKRAADAVLGSIETGAHRELQRAGITGGSYDRRHDWGAIGNLFNSAKQSQPQQVAEKPNNLHTDNQGNSSLGYHIQGQVNPNLTLDQNIRNLKRTVDAAHAQEFSKFGIDPNDPKAYTVRVGKNDGKNLYIQIYYKIAPQGTK